MRSFGRKLTVAALLAAGALLAAACAPDAESVCKDNCEQYEKCAATEFYNNFSSISECRRYCEAQMADYRAQDSDRCYDARLEYSDCIANLSCSELVAYYNGGGQCHSEESDFVNRCGVTY